MVVDKQNGIVGSCATYYTRKDVTSLIRSPKAEMKLGYEEVFKRYVQKLMYELCFILLPVNFDSTILSFIMGFSTAGGKALMSL